MQVLVVSLAMDVRIYFAALSDLHSEVTLKYVGSPSKKVFSFLLPTNLGLN